MSDEVLLTKEGYEKIELELDDLKSVQRPAVAARIKEAREFGDISENAEYDAAKNEQAELEERIAKLEDMIRKARIIDESEAEKGIVNVGCKVEVHNAELDQNQTYVIVGATESDPFAGKISNESAVGKGLIGHKVGESVDIDLPDRKVRYTVLSVERP